MTQEQINTVTAEGSYAARHGEFLNQNPYPAVHDFAAAWATGFINGMYRIRADAEITRRSFHKAVDNNGKLLEQLNQLQADFDMYRDEVES